MKIEIDNGSGSSAPIHIDTIDPTVNDDVANYVVGHKWVNTTTDTIFMCVDNSLHAAIWKEIVTSPELLYYDCTVGTGGNYPAVDGIKLAIADGKRKLLIISDIVENSAWGLPVNAILYITGGQQFKITLNGLSLGTDSTQRIEVHDIEFYVKKEITDAYYFNNAKLYLYNSIIRNNSDGDSTHFSKNLNGDEITVYTDTDGISIWFKKIKLLTIYGNRTYTDPYQLYFQNSEIDKLIFSGIFTRYITVVDTFISVIIMTDVISGATLAISNSTLKSGIDLNIFFSGNNNKIYDSSINHIENAISGKYGEFHNCKFTNAQYVSANNTVYFNCQFDYTGNISISQNFNSFKNCTFNNIVSQTGNNILFDNCIFNDKLYAAGNYSIINNSNFYSSITISLDHIKLNNCYFYNDTITVNNTADKCVIMNTSTLTSIVDNNPTSTQIIAPNLI